MFVSRKSLPLLVACLAAPVTASMAAAQDTNGARPTAATLTAKIDSIVKVDVLAQGMPSVSKHHLVHKSGMTFAQAGKESVTFTFLVDTNGAVTGFVVNSSGTERTLRRIN